MKSQTDPLAQQVPFMANFWSEKFVLKIWDTNPKGDEGIC
ncbi:hypothetical protein M2350_002862 [Candidatus Fervidibacter sacchari]|uniref:Uncharacterized protein n=1 Tax=Candidatus Fervidibacter sacchari TaxID=1448929 RepID=A0ABT2ER35_9BACT|nr:hypothetical protein [Candidatus Fervidibacter sacchari]